MGEDEEKKAVPAEPRPSDDVEITPIPEVFSDEIPDGGLVAWLQVAGAFALFFNSWGIANTFGVYQTYYETHFLSSSTPDAIAWIGSLQSFLLLAGGLVSGPLFDGGWFRATIAFGSIAVCFGFMMMSLATQYWQIILAQGFCIGLGAGCMVVPSLSILPQYFLKKRALVTGFTVCGSSLGGVIYPLIFQGLIDNVGFGWTNRILGFISIITCSFSVAVMRLRAKPRKVRSPFDPKAFREPAYLFYCFAMFCSNFGFFPPIFYLQTYALGHGLTNTNIALKLVAILNAASILGRLAPSPAVGLIGPINTMIVVIAMASTVAFTWIAVHTGAGNIVFAVMYGFTSGGIVSLPAVVLASITEDLSFMGSRLGTSNFCNAIASLCGPPLAGAILRSTGKYLGVQLFSGFLLLGACLFFVVTRFARVGFRLAVNV
ncbi:Uncharacterized protein SAPIO_CDS2487 [Scedosporium apiospermum]|uniref:Major facilitator superfamily (MFS) profile domain-containing protein n=1 Tax=Pseudallescheria apiosperma TaxID=563466 RepID=A0A084GCK2_PSEDA|nr:Uncharacterized protein SAPIO_CDS2487 [Scedosporium apiospermum]KEZ45064.1 Uncharacterized protein SAPIO_CDS2487 [Scedosporium apiospermum]